MYLVVMEDEFHRGMTVTILQQPLDVEAFVYAVTGRVVPWEQIEMKAIIRQRDLEWEVMASDGMHIVPPDGNEEAPGWFLRVLVEETR